METKFHLFENEAYEREQQGKWFIVVEWISSTNEERLCEIFFDDLKEFVGWQMDKLPIYFVLDGFGTYPELPEKLKQAYKGNNIDC